jgi:hypothetical protein
MIENIYINLSTLYAFCHTSVDSVIRNFLRTGFLVYRLTFTSMKIGLYAPILSNQCLMQENNYPELISQMDALGLGKDPALHLLNGVYQEVPVIKLHVRNTVSADQIDAFLHFVKEENSAKYVFTHWDLKVRNQEQALSLQQTFSVLGRKDPVTLMEGYNLLQGRSIYKTLYTDEGNKLPTWCALDFKNTDQHGNFNVKLLGNQYNLEALISRYPIKELQAHWDKKCLLRALEEGQRMPVTIWTEKNDQKVYIEAAPRFNAVKFYNSEHQPINILKSLQQNQNQEKTIRKSEAHYVQPKKMGV